MAHTRNKCNVNSEGKPLRPPKSYSCDLCGQQYGALYELRTHHTESHPTDNFPFECETCGKSFLVKTKLEIHNLKHMNLDLVAPVAVVEDINPAAEKPFVQTPTQSAGAFGAGKQTHFCTICNAVFVLEQRLYAHMCTVHRPCSKCTNLHQCHCVLAPGQKIKVRCNVCGQAYTNPRALKKHMTLHTGKWKLHKTHCLTLCIQDK